MDEHTRRRLTITLAILAVALALLARNSTLCMSDDEALKFLSGTATAVPCW